MDNRVGQRVVVKVPHIDLSEGMVGFIIRETRSTLGGSRSDVTVIFETGDIETFSQEMVKKHLKRGLDVLGKYSGYEYESEDQVLRDYRAGFWKFRTKFKRNTKRIVSARAAAQSGDGLLAYYKEPNE